MILQKDNVRALLDHLAADRDVFVPATVNDVKEFALYRDGVEPDFDMVNTTMPPKDLLFPQTQKMYHFSVGEDGSYVIGEFDESREQVAFGIRPCDMRSIACLDEVFLTKGFVDDFYAGMRDKLTTVAIGCTRAEETCFCESMGVSPVDAPNADVMLLDGGDAYLVKAQSERGQAEVERWAQFTEEGELEPLGCEVPLKVDAAGIMGKLDRMYEDEIWDNLSVKCLNCGTCTYVCPTCHCFDISQENRKKEGVRFRCWDSCMFSEYTLMAGFHNPRPTKLERVRNRFMHKLCFFEQRYGMSLCVGCGRCVEKCPVALDITRLIDDVAATELEEKEAAHV